MSIEVEEVSSKFVILRNLSEDQFDVICANMPIIGTATECVIHREDLADRVVIDVLQGRCN